MAQRRMFSQRITESAKFLKMPASTQSLYFHLGMNADDDGVAEAFKIMRTIGATEDDLKVLIAKEYVILLNDDLVTYITHWREHNKIRADRKIDSIHKDLLLRIVDDVDLLEHKPRADRKVGRPRDDQGTAQDRLGKDRLGKVRSGKYSKTVYYDPVFEEMWILYEKVGNKSQAYKTFKKVHPDNHEAIFRHIPEYVKSTPGGAYRKHFSTYLNNECWNDEIIKKPGRKSFREADPFFDNLSDEKADAIMNLSNYPRQLN